MCNYSSTDPPTDWEKWNNKESDLSRWEFVEERRRTSFKRQLKGREGIGKRGALMDMCVKEEEETTRPYIPNDQPDQETAAGSPPIQGFESSPRL